MKSLKEMIAFDIKLDSEYQQLNESISISVESKGFLDKLKERLKKEATKFGKETILSILNMYNVIINHRTPLKDKLAAIAVIVCFIFPDSKMSAFLPDDAPKTTKELVDYSSNFLEDYITNDIEEKSLEIYDEWFGDNK